MEERRQRERERELVLAPNEFAYVLDTTKGHINCYVGPNKTSLAQTDQPVVFDPVTHRYQPADLADATQLFPTATRNGYIVLANPAKDDEHPTLGVSNAMKDLKVGERIVIPGPASFPLWPGQTAQVLDGHRLRSNEFLYVEIYQAEAAQESWTQALGAEEDPEPEFTVGDVIAIKGSDVSFFVPPTGVQVVPDEHGNFVRSAVTLQRLEYCILRNEDGTEDYIRGEAVVFPEPQQTFVIRDNQRKFRAIEVSETKGIHVKVIVPYSDDDGDHVEGEELFITGKNRIYFPRAEHAQIRYAGHDVHHAVAVPKGQGRYVLNRESGEVRLVRGPVMFLPDPRREVLTQRLLTSAECALLYPGNREVLAFNQAGGQPAPKSARPAPKTQDPEPDGEFERSYVPPRSITLDNRFTGAVKVEVWPGYAVQKVDSAGQRTVIQGPETVLLEFDESLSALNFSTGIPKDDDSPLRTAYLRKTGNCVSDLVMIESADLVPVWLRVAYRVDFGGDDPGLWFAVEDYVRLICDHGASLIKAAARVLPIRDLQGRITDVVRDAVLGPKPQKGKRPGRTFSENGMFIYDIEVLDIEIDDEAVHALLDDTRTQSIERAVEVLAKERQLEDESRLNEVKRRMMRERQITDALSLELEEALVARRGQAQMQAAQLEAQIQAFVQQTQLEEAQLNAHLVSKRLETTQQIHAQSLDHDKAEQELRILELEARVAAATSHAQAFSPHLVQALTRLADEQLVHAVADGFSELAAVEGRGLLETARKFMDFVPMTSFPQLKPTDASGE